MLTQSYPTAFDGWLSDALMGYLTVNEPPHERQDDSYHGSGSSFFPQTMNHPASETTHTGRLWVADGRQVRRTLVCALSTDAGDCGTLCQTISTFTQVKWRAVATE